VKPRDYSLFWVAAKVGIEMSYSVTDRLLIGTLLSAAFGAMSFIASVFMPNGSTAYVPAIWIASLCAAAFVGFFVAYLLASNSKR